MLVILFYFLSNDRLSWINIFAKYSNSVQTKRTCLASVWAFRAYVLDFFLLRTLASILLLLLSYSIWFLFDGSLLSLVHI